MSKQLNPLLPFLLDETGTQYGTLGSPFPATGIYRYGTDGALWLETVDPTGHLVTTLITPAPSTGSGSPIGLLLALTYA